LASKCYSKHAEVKPHGNEKLGSTQQLTYSLKIQLNTNLPSRISLLLYGSTPVLFNNDHLHNQPIHFGITDKSSLLIFMDLKVCR